MLPLLLLLPLPVFPLHFVLFALLSCHSLATLAHVNYATTTTTTSLGMYGTRMVPLQPLPAPPLSQTRLCRCGPRPSREDLDSLEILIRLIQFLIHGVCARHTLPSAYLPLTPSLSLSVLALPSGSFCRQAMSPYLSRWGTRIPIQSAICIDNFTGRPEQLLIWRD